MNYSLPELMDLIKSVNRNKKLNPMSVEEIKRLRIRKYRDEANTETVELPESLKALLAYDRDMLTKSNIPVLHALLAQIDAEGVIHSATPDIDAYYGMSMDESGKSLDELMPVWNDDAKLPALVRINHAGDQSIFIYVTEPDPQGEYPIARMERFELWLAESSLIEYMYFINGIGTEDNPLWEKQREANQIRDEKMINLERFHDALFDKLDEMPD